MRVTSDTYIIHQAKIVVDGSIFDSGWLKVEHGIVTEMGAGDLPLTQFQRVSVPQIDARGCWLVPGFIDMHVHGGDGADVMDASPSSIRKIGRFHAEHGTTGWLPTTLTSAIDATVDAIQAVESVRLATTRGNVHDGAAVLGLHLEGPFISPRKKGAQNPAFILDPVIAQVEQFVQAAPGLIRKVTIAPELSGGIEAIHWLSEQGIISSIGHTDGTMAEVAAGIEAGATHATHMFNAMNGLHHRDGGSVIPLLLSERVICELIADCHHVHPEVMKLLVRMKGSDHVALITDAMAAAGGPDGCYQLGGLDVNVRDGQAYLADGHTLAGSTLTMDRAFKNMVSRVGVSMVDVVTMASATPAKELGYVDHKGSLKVGYDADMVLLDESLSVVATFVAGRQVYGR